MGLLAIFLSACATVPTDPEDRADFEALNDPFEPGNRAVFAFNRTIGRFLLDPVARGYRYVVPELARTGVGNILANLRAPFTLANDLLQGQVGWAGATLTRVLVNSTAGIGGMIDVADHLGISPHDNDVGRTFAAWGMPAGAYLVLPLLGPSNLRDTAGLTVEAVLEPVDVILGAYGLNEVVFGRAAGEILDNRAANIDKIDRLESTALDFYATMRTVYRQDRAKELRDKGQLKLLRNIVAAAPGAGDKGAGHAVAAVAPVAGDAVVARGSRAPPTAPAPRVAMEPAAPSVDAPSFSRSSLPADVVASLNEALRADARARANTVLASRIAGAEQLRTAAIQKRGTEATLAFAVIAAIARHPSATAPIVRAAVAAAPESRVAIVARARAAFPGFAATIERAADLNSDSR